MITREEQKRLCFKLITFTVIIAFLCQDLAWAKGTNALMPDNKQIMSEFIETFSNVQDICEAWRSFISKNPSYVESIDRLTPDEKARLKKFIEENKDSLPGCALLIFSELLGIKIPAGKKEKEPAEEPGIHVLIPLKQEFLYKDYFMGLEGAGFYEIRDFILKTLGLPDKTEEKTKEMINKMCTIIKNELSVDIKDELPGRLKRQNTELTLRLYEELDSLFYAVEPKPSSFLEINKKALLMMRELNMDPKIIAFLMTMRLFYDQLFSQQLGEADLDRMRPVIYSELIRRYKLDMEWIWTFKLLEEKRIEQDNILIQRTVEYFKEIGEHNIYSSLNHVWAPVAIYWHPGAVAMITRGGNEIDRINDLIIFPRGDVDPEGYFGMAGILSQRGPLGKMSEGDVIGLAGRILRGKEGFEIYEEGFKNTYYIYEEGKNIYELKILNNGCISGVMILRPYRTALIQIGDFTLADADKLALIINQEIPLHIPQQLKKDKAERIKEIMENDREDYPVEVFLNEKTKDIYVIDIQSGDTIIIDRNGEYKTFIRKLSMLAFFANSAYTVISKQILKDYEPAGEFKTWRAKAKELKDMVAKLKKKGYGDMTILSAGSWIPGYGKEVLGKDIPEEVLFSYIDRNIKEGNNACPGSSRAPVRFYRMRSGEVVVLNIGFIKDDRALGLKFIREKKCWQGISDEEIKNNLGETLSNYKWQKKESGGNTYVYLKGSDRNFYLATVNNGEVIRFSKVPYYKLGLYELGICDYESSFRISDMLNEGRYLSKVQGPAVNLLSGIDSDGNRITRRVYCEKVQLKGGGEKKILHVVDDDRFNTCTINASGVILEYKEQRRRFYYDGNIIREKFQDITDAVLEPVVNEEIAGKSFIPSAEPLPSYGELEFIKNKQIIDITGGYSYDYIVRLEVIQSQIYANGPYSDCCPEGNLTSLAQESINYFRIKSLKKSLVNYLENLLEKGQNKKIEDIYLKIAESRPVLPKKPLGRNSARYFCVDMDWGIGRLSKKAIIVFDESFIRILLGHRLQFPNAVKWILIERLLHELSHDNNLGDRKAGIEEEIKVILDNDMKLYKAFVYHNQPLMDEIDKLWNEMSKDEKEIMQSNEFFNMLKEAVETEEQRLAERQTQEAVYDYIREKIVCPFVEEHYPKGVPGVVLHGKGFPSAANKLHVIFNKAIHREDIGKIISTGKEMLKIIRQDSSTFDYRGSILAQMAIACQKSGRYKEGEGYAKQGISELGRAKGDEEKIKITNILLLSTLGNCYMGLDRNNEAIEVYKKALDLNPTEDRIKQIRLRLGVAYYMAGLYKEAKEHLEWCIGQQEIQGLDRAYLYLGRITLAEGNYTEAISFYEKGLETVKGDREGEEEFYLAELEVYLSQEKKQDALNTIEKWLELDIKPQKRNWESLAGILIKNTKGKFSQLEWFFQRLYEENQDYLLTLYCTCILIGDLADKDEFRALVVKFLINQGKSPLTPPGGEEISRERALSIMANSLLPMDPERGLLQEAVDEITWIIGQLKESRDIDGLGNLLKKRPIKKNRELREKIETALEEIRGPREEIKPVLPQVEITEPREEIDQELERFISAFKLLTTPQELFGNKSLFTEEELRAGLKKIKPKHREETANSFITKKIEESIGWLFRKGVIGTYVENAKKKGWVQTLKKLAEEFAKKKTECLKDYNKNIDDIKHNLKKGDDLLVRKLVQEINGRLDKEINKSNSIRDAEYISQIKKLKEITQEVEKEVDFYREVVLPGLRDISGKLETDLEEALNMWEELVEKIAGHNLLDLGQNRLAKELKARMEAVELEHKARMEAVELEHKARMEAVELEHKARTEAMELELKAKTAAMELELKAKTAAMELELKELNEAKEALRKYYKSSLPLDEIEKVLSQVKNKNNLELAKQELDKLLNKKKAEILDSCKKKLETEGYVLEDTKEFCKTLVDFVDLQRAKGIIKADQLAQMFGDGYYKVEEITEDRIFVKKAAGKYHLVIAHGVTLDELETGELRRPIEEFFRKHIVIDYTLEQLVKWDEMVGNMKIDPRTEEPKKVYDAVIKIIKGVLDENPVFQAEVGEEYLIENNISVRWIPKKILVIDFPEFNESRDLPILDEIFIDDIWNEVKEDCPFENIYVTGASPEVNQYLMRRMNAGFRLQKIRDRILALLNKGISPEQWERIRGPGNYLRRILDLNDNDDSVIGLFKLLVEKGRITLSPKLLSGDSGNVIITGQVRTSNGDTTLMFLKFILTPGGLNFLRVTSFDDIEESSNRIFLEYLDIGHERVKWNSFKTILERIESSDYMVLFYLEKRYFVCLDKKNKISQLILPYADDIREGRIVQDLADFENFHIKDRGFYKVFLFGSMLMIETEPIYPSRRLINIDNLRSPGGYYNYSFGLFGFSQAIFSFFSFLGALLWTEHFGWLEFRNEIIEYIKFKLLKKSFLPQALEKTRIFNFRPASGEKTLNTIIIWAALICIYIVFISVFPVSAIHIAGLTGIGILATAGLIRKDGEQSDTYLKERIKKGCLLNELKKKDLSIKEIWQIIISYNEALSELEGKITWEKKVMLWGERNYWRGKLWGYKDNMHWKEIAAKAGINKNNYRQIQRAFFYYLLEIHNGDLEAIKKDERFIKLDIKADIEKWIRDNNLISRWHLIKALAKKGENLDNEERIALMRELIKGNHQADPAFPSFSYTAETKSYVGHEYFFIPFLCTTIEMKNYALIMRKNVKEIFGKGAKVKVESIFDKNNYGWIFKVEGQDRRNQKKTIYYIINEDKTGMNLIDPLQQSIIDAAGHKANTFGKTTTPCSVPQGELDTAYGKALILEMTRYNRFSDQNLLLYPFKIRAAFNYTRYGGKIGKLNFGEIEGRSVNVSNMKLEDKEEYYIEFYFSKTLNRWICFVYKVLKSGSVSKKPAIAFTSKEKNGRTRLRQLDEQRIEDCLKEKRRGIKKRTARPERKEKQRQEMKIVEEDADLELLEELDKIEQEISERPEKPLKEETAEPEIGIDINPGDIWWVRIDGEIMTVTIKETDKKNNRIIVIWSSGFEEELTLLEFSEMMVCKSAIRKRLKTPSEPSTFLSEGEPKSCSELSFDGRGVIIKSNSHKKLENISRKYINNQIGKRDFKDELKRYITIDPNTSNRTASKYLRNFIVRAFIISLDKIKERINDELVELLFKGIFGNEFNQGKDIIIRTSPNLSRNSSRYYIENHVIIVFNKQFIRAVREPLNKKLDLNKRSWLFCERLFHELYHKNPGTHLDKFEEEVRTTLNCDLVLYKFIGQRLIKEEDLKNIKRFLKSGKYYRFLQSLLYQSKEEKKRTVRGYAWNHIDNNTFNQIIKSCDFQGRIKTAYKAGEKTYKIIVRFQGITGKLLVIDFPGFIESKHLSILDGLLIKDIWDKVKEKGPFEEIFVKGAGPEFNAYLTERFKTAGSLQTIRETILTAFDFENTIIHNNVKDRMINYKKMFGLKNDDTAVISLFRLIVKNRQITPSFSKRKSKIITIAGQIKKKGGNPVWVLLIFKLSGKRVELIWDRIWENEKDTFNSLFMEIIRGRKSKKVNQDTLDTLIKRIGSTEYLVVLNLKNNTFLCLNKQNLSQELFDIYGTIKGGVNIPNLESWINYHTEKRGYCKVSTIGNIITIGNVAVYPPQKLITIPASLKAEGRQARSHASIKTFLAWILLTSLPMALYALFPGAHIIDAEKIAAVGLGIPIIIGMAGKYSGKGQKALEQLKQLKIKIMEEFNKKIMEEFNKLNGARPLWLRILRQKFQSIPKCLRDSFGVKMEMLPNGFNISKSLSLVTIIFTLALIAVSKTMLSAVSLQILIFILGLTTIVLGLISMMFLAGFSTNAIYFIIGNVAPISMLSHLVDYTMHIGFPQILFKILKNLNPSLWFQRIHELFYGINININGITHNLHLPILDSWSKKRNKFLNGNTGIPYQSSQCTPVQCFMAWYRKNRTDSFFLHNYMWSNFPDNPPSFLKYLYRLAARYIRRELWHLYNYLSKNIIFVFKLISFGPFVKYFKAINYSISNIFKSFSNSLTLTYTTGYSRTLSNIPAILARFYNYFISHVYISIKYYSLTSIKGQGGTNSAVATTGMYTKEQHKKMNEKVYGDIREERYIKLQTSKDPDIIGRPRLQNTTPMYIGVPKIPKPKIGAGIEVPSRLGERWSKIYEGLDEETKQALEDVSIFLLPPEDPEYPYYLRTEVIDGELEQVGEFNSEVEEILREIIYANASGDIGQYRTRFQELGLLLLRLLNSMAYYSSFSFRGQINIPPISDTISAKIKEIFHKRFAFKKTSDKKNPIINAWNKFINAFEIKVLRLFVQKLIVSTKTILLQTAMQVNRISANSAIATPGLYTKEQHEKMNEKAYNDIQQNKFVEIHPNCIGTKSKFQIKKGSAMEAPSGIDERAQEIMKSLDEETRQTLEDVSIFLLPPENPEYPYYLRTEIIDGELEYQVAHAGSFLGRTRNVFMTAQAFMELPIDIIVRILKREARLARERYEARKAGNLGILDSLGGYDEEAKEILQKINMWAEVKRIYAQLIEGIKAKYPPWEPPSVEELWKILAFGKMPDAWPGMVTAMREDRIIDEKDFGEIAGISEIVEKAASGTVLTPEHKALIAEAIFIKLKMDRKKHTYSKAPKQSPPLPAGDRKAKIGIIWQEADPSVILPDEIRDSPEKYRGEIENALFKKGLLLGWYKEIPHKSVICIKPIAGIENGVNTVVFRVVLNEKEPFALKYVHQIWAPIGLQFGFIRTLANSLRAKFPGKPIPLPKLGNWTKIDGKEPVEIYSEEFVGDKYKDAEEFIEKQVFESIQNQKDRSRIMNELDILRISYLAMIWYASLNKSGKGFIFDMLNLGDFNYVWTDDGELAPKFFDFSDIYGGGYGNKESGFTDGIGFYSSINRFYSSSGFEKKYNDIINPSENFIRGVIRGLGEEKGRELLKKASCIEGEYIECCIQMEKNEQFGLLAILQAHRNPLELGLFEKRYENILFNLSLKYRYYFNSGDLLEWNNERKLVLIDAENLNDEQLKIIDAELLRNTREGNKKIYVFFTSSKGIDVNEKIVRYRQRGYLRNLTDIDILVNYNQFGDIPEDIFPDSLISYAKLRYMEVNGVELSNSSIRILIPECRKTIWKNFIDMVSIIDGRIYVNGEYIDLSIKAGDISSIEEAVLLERVIGDEA